jgi:Domain of unknown function DUF123
LLRALSGWRTIAPVEHRANPNPGNLCEQHYHCQEVSFDVLLFHEDDFVARSCPLLVTASFSPGSGQDSVKQPGCYSLIIYLRKKTLIRIGKLGQAVFPAGTYVYTGSAMGGLEPRLKRHLRSKKKLRWHIDYRLHAREADKRDFHLCIRTG